MEYNIGDIIAATAENTIAINAIQTTTFVQFILNFFFFFFSSLFLFNLYSPLK